MNAPLVPEPSSREITVILSELPPQLASIVAASATDVKIAASFDVLVFMI